MVCADFGIFKTFQVNFVNDVEVQKEKYRGEERNTLKIYVLKLVQTDEIGNANDPF